MPHVWNNGGGKGEGVAAGAERSRAKRSEDGLRTVRNGQRDTCTISLPSISASACWRQTIASVWLRSSKVVVLVLMTVERLGRGMAVPWKLIEAAPGVPARLLVKRARVSPFGAQRGPPLKVVVLVLMTVERRCRGMTVPWKETEAVPGDAGAVDVDGADGAAEPRR